MRTTIAIDERLIEELMRMEPDVSRFEAMRRAIEQYVRRKRHVEFLGLAGAGLVDMDWKETERLELKKLKKLKKHGRKR